MDEIKARFRLIGSMFDSGMAVFAASMEKFAAEMTEAAKSFPEREYWRGYTDAMRDVDDIKQSEEEKIIYARVRPSPEQVRAALKAWYGAAPSVGDRAWGEMEEALYAALNVKDGA